MTQLAGKKVLITGALGTIGRALVSRFAEEGATVIALDRPDAASAQETLGKDVRYFGCDLNQLSATETAVSKLADEVGGIDVLINNAALVIMKPFESFSIEEYEDQVGSIPRPRSCWHERAAAMKAKNTGRSSTSRRSR